MMYEHSDTVGMAYQAFVAEVLLQQDCIALDFQVDGTFAIGLCISSSILQGCGLPIWQVRLGGLDASPVKPAR